MNTPPPLPEAPAPAEPQTPPMSLAARLVNVFAVPGDVFEEIRPVPHSAANWLVPVLIACVVGVASVLIVFSQPAIVQQIREKQSQAMEKKFDKEIQAGRMTRAQADQTMAMVERFFGATVLKISGSVGVVGYSFARVFFWALVLWVTGRWLFKGEFGYLKAAEVAGLAGMIGVLGAIVTLLLRVNFSDPAASPSLALTLHKFDEKNISHMLLAMVNLFDLWQVGVLAAGLARLARVRFVQAALPLLVFWTLVSAVLGTLSALAVKLGS
jgi:hypothetical protein